MVKNFLTSLTTARLICYREQTINCHSALSVRAAPQPPSYSTSLELARRALIKPPLPPLPPSGRPCWREGRQPFRTLYLNTKLSSAMPMSFGSPRHASVATYQRSTRCPARAPVNVTRLTASVYHMATNRGESSGQWVA